MGRRPRRRVLLDRVVLHMTPEQRAEMVGRAQWLPGDWPDDITALVDENHLLEAKLGLALEQIASLKQHAVDLGRLAAGGGG